MKALGVIAVASALFVSSRAEAATGCSFGGIVGMTFGGYDPFSSAPVDSAGSITFSCTGVVPGDTARITLSTGLAGSYVPRAMMSGANRLQYNVYVDPARTVIFGDGSGGSIPILLPMTETPTTINVFGRIAPLQRVSVGEYQDTIIATILY